MSSSSVPKAGLIRVRKAWGEVDTRLWSRQEQREVQRISQAGAQAAEKGQLSGKSCKKHASGAKACGELPTLCGVETPISTNLARNYFRIAGHSGATVSGQASGPHLETATPVDMVDDYYLIRQAA